MDQGLLLARDILPHRGDNQHRVAAATQEFQALSRRGGGHLQEPHGHRRAALPLAQGEQRIDVALAMPAVQGHQKLVHAVDEAIGAIIEIRHRGRAFQLIGTIAGDDHRRPVAADAVVDRNGRPAHGTQGVKSRGIVPDDVGFSLTLRDIVHQLARHRHLELGFLAERHTDGVTQALRHQRTDAHSALDTPVLAESGFGNA